MNKSLFIFISVVIIICFGIFFIINKTQDYSFRLPTSTPTQAPAQKQNTSTNGFKTSYDIAEIPVFAHNVTGVRDLQFTPGQTLLASQTSEGKVVAINSSGEVKVLLSGLKNPHGLAFYNTNLYVAEERAVNRYKWNEKELQATDKEKLIDLPAGGRHFTRSIVFDKQGKMYVSIGSTCDTCVETNDMLTSVITADANGKNVRVYSSGLRNAVFLAVNPTSGAVWVTEMGRDYLGDDIPNDEVNVLKDGANYGWPYCYNNQIRDKAFQPQTTKDCTKTEAPVFEIPAHSAPLGLTFIESSKFPSDWQGDLLVTYHGSWNRSVPDGYKIVHLKVQGNTVTTSDDFITGFIQGNTVIARPVDTTFDNEGNLYISDDKAGLIYKLMP